jgi:hypothetical protein
MTEVPKIVHERLRAASREQGHPDANQLTAFAEQALTPTERDGVLAHLAACRDCRELISVALPAADAVAIPIADGAALAAPVAKERKEKNEKSWLKIPLLAWTNLRWAAALAAGVVVIAAVVLVRPGKQDQAAQSPINSQNATIAAINSAPLAAPPAPTNQPATLASHDAKQPPGIRSSSSLLLSKKLAAPNSIVPPKPAGRMAVTTMDMTVVMAKPAVPSPLPSNNPPSTATGAQIGQRNEVVEVAAESAGVQPESSSSPENGVAARKDAPAVEKAKPAPETETSQLQDTISTSTVKELPLQGRNFTALTQSRAANQALARSLTITWTIAGGVLQRSFDSGQTWQNALRADHPLLCYKTRGEDVWTGGQAGTLFHSRDDGTTWTKVQPAIKSQPLTSDLTNIDLLSEDNHATMRIVLTTSSQEVWSSTDGGKTWDKK